MRGNHSYLAQHKGGAIRVLKGEKMSTKSTLFYDCKTDWHLYEECFENDAVYAEGSHKKQHYIIRIPLLVWEKIRVDKVPPSILFMIPRKMWTQFRRFTNGVMNAFLMPREEWREECKKRIVERKSRYKAAKTEGKRNLASLFGCLTYGDVKDSVEKQLASAMREYDEMQDRIRKSKKQKIAIEERQNLVYKV